MIAIIIILSLLLLVIIITSLSAIKEKIIDKPKKEKTALIQKLKEEQEKNNSLENQLQLYKQYEDNKMVLDFAEQLNQNKELPERLEEVLNLICDPIEYKRATKLFDLQQRVYMLEEELKFYKSSKSNLTAIPYMAQIVADYETLDIEKLAYRLDWGQNVERAKKVASLREIRKATKKQIEECEVYKYQLAYLIQLFPKLEDVIETDYHELPTTSFDNITEFDPAFDYLSKEEYYSLNEAARNQLALDRYMHSHRKTKWQIGRDYENYIGYEYSELGYNVDYYGSKMGLEDLGRDLICTKEDKTLIIQCKYWSKKKQIHENHITQLFGTMTSYCIEKEKPKSKVKGILVTNIYLSNMAKQMADYLGISYVENCPMGEYPVIKCNINKHGEKIYHLPFDQQYDNTIIDKDGEFFAMSVNEAEKAGFRRAYKWYG